jgi:hypothetical protein
LGGNPTFVRWSIRGFARRANLSLIAPSAGGFSGLAASPSSSERAAQPAWNREEAEVHRVLKFFEEIFAELCAFRGSSGIVDA